MVQDRFDDAEVSGERAATDSTLRFENQHVDAGGGEKPRRA
jgi:hypothetical protein